jgi:hypothetical protein
MAKNRTALLILLVAAIAAFGSPWMGEPMDIAAVALASILGSLSIVLVFAARVARAS